MKFDDLPSGTVNSSCIQDAFSDSASIDLESIEAASRHILVDDRRLVGLSFGPNE
jgi:hypothetical protein